MCLPHVRGRNAIFVTFSPSLIQYDHTTSPVFSVFFVTDEVTSISTPTTFHSPLCFVLVPDSIFINNQIQPSVLHSSIFQLHVRVWTMNYTLKYIFRNIPVFFFLKFWQTFCFKYICHMFVYNFSQKTRREETTLETRRRVILKLI
jgi:hypothetical protein